MREIPQFCSRNRVRELFHQRLDLADYDLVNSYDVFHGQIKSVTCASHKSSTGFVDSALLVEQISPYKNNDILERLLETLNTNVTNS